MLHLTAIQYRQTFNTGRTRPWLIEAETIDGERHEVVVKPSSEFDGGFDGAARELTASLLARALHLQTPQPSIVEITPEFAESVLDGETKQRFLANIGWHFASKHLGRGWNAIPYGAELPARLFPAAASLFAFDAAIGNDDRHPAKTNYLIRGSTLMAIDHERAFPTPGAGVIRPWEIGGLHFLRRHAFYAGLRGQMPDFEPFHAAANALSVQDLAAIVAAIPAAWDRRDVSADLHAYLVALRTNIRTVIDHAAALLQ